MIKPVNFSTYKMLQKLSLNDFNRWVISVYNSGVQDGINITNNDVIAEVTDETLYELIRSVKGVGENRTQEIIEKILGEGLLHGSET